MNAISHILRAREKFPEAMEYLRSILKLDPNNGDVWGSLGEHEPRKPQIKTKLILAGHCYLMMDNLQEAYTAYQQALYYLRDPKVSPARCPKKQLLLMLGPGTETLVWNWYIIRPIWFT